MPQLVRLGQGMSRFGGNPLAAYAANGVNPVHVADFGNDRFFVNSERSTFADMFTFGRSSVGYAFDSDGSWSEYASGVARIGHHVDFGAGYVNAGMLFEPQAATDLILHTEDLTNAAWVKNNTTIIANNASSPVGDVTMDRVTATAAADATVAQTVTLPSSGTYTFQAVVQQSQPIVYLRAEGFDMAGGADTCWFQMSTDAVLTQQSGIIDAGIMPLNGQNHLVWITFSTTTDLTGDLIIGHANADNTTNCVNGGIFYLWGMNLHEGPYPTSYVEATSSTVTRPAESLSLKSAAAMSTTALCMAMEGSIHYVDGGATRTLLDRRVSGTEYAFLGMSGASTRSGAIVSEFRNTTQVSKTDAAPTIAEAINQPFNFACRMVSGVAIQNAYSGTSIAEAVTAINLADLNSATTDIAEGVGLGEGVISPSFTFKKIIWWNEDIGEDGIVEASS